jgi:hypothetical protein
VTSDWDFIQIARYTYAALAFGLTWFVLFRQPDFQLDDPAARHVFFLRNLGIAAFLVITGSDEIRRAYHAIPFSAWRLPSYYVAMGFIAAAGWKARKWDTDAREGG